MPNWVRDVVWWQVFPLGFTGAPGELGSLAEASVTHRLAQLHAWLDYATELGCTGLALGPIFASETHGYDTVDHYRIDPRLGNDDDFAALVSAAHERGMKVLLDGVFNHVGYAHPLFQQALAGSPSESSEWFHLEWPDDWQPGMRPNYQVFEGHGGLITLNHESAQVREYVRDVMGHWLERGADGWRLDAAYAVPESFWAAVIPEVRQRHPEAYLVGEVIHGDYVGFVRYTGVDAVTEYELWKSTWSALNDGNFFELAWTLKRHNEFLDSFTPLTFIGNHDVTRIASQLHNEHHVPLALVVLLTAGGTPSIYYGDEQAFRGVKEDRIGGDDEVRPAFPTSPAELAPYGWPTYHLHQELIALRRRHPWLHQARVEQLQLENQHFSYQVGAEGNRLIVALNCAEHPVDLAAPGATTVLAGPGTLRGEGEHTRVELAGCAWAVVV